MFSVRELNSRSGFLIGQRLCPPTALPVRGVQSEMICYTHIRIADISETRMYALCLVTSHLVHKNIMKAGMAPVDNFRCRTVGVVEWRYMGERVEVFCPEGWTHYLVMDGFDSRCGEEDHGISISVRKHPGKREAGGVLSRRDMVRLMKIFEEQLKRFPLDE